MKKLSKCLPLHTLAGKAVFSPRWVNLIATCDLLVENNDPGWSGGHLQENMVNLTLVCSKSFFLPLSFFYGNWLFMILILFYSLNLSNLIEFWLGNCICLFNQHIFLFRLCNAFLFFFLHFCKNTFLIFLPLWSSLCSKTFITSNSRTKLLKKLASGTTWYQDNIK